MSLSSQSEYRPDIDGLRAIAVLSVVAFHAFPSAMPGGFIGVDIFFVISGYLISGIIVKGLNDGSFSYGDFYARRIRRIFPALFLVLTTTAVLGWFFLFPKEFKLLGRHLIAGAGFASNLLQWSESGYFDAAAESKPLLHLWSLGIEEQFYIFYPILLFFLWRRTNKLFMLIAAIAGISFFLNIFEVRRQPVAAFYSPATRMWELLVGSCLAYFERFSLGLYFRNFVSENIKNVCALIGLAAISITLVFLNKTKSFPGWWALLPVVGTVVMIAAGPQTWLGKNILANRVLVVVGLISYPLYLWHWPLLSFLSIIGNDPPSSTARAFTVALSLLLAFLSFSFIEKPIRFRTWPRVSASVLASVLGVIAVVGCAINFVDTPTRLSRSGALTRIFAAVNDWDYPGNDAEINGASKEKIILIGDSYLQHYYSRIKSVVEKSDRSYSVLYAGVGGCPPLPNVRRIADPGGGCVLANNAAFSRAMMPDVKGVVFGSAWHYFYPISERSKTQDPDKFEHDSMLFAEGDRNRRGIKPGSAAFAAAFADFGKFVGELKSAGKKVYIVLPTPISDEFDPKLMIDRLSNKEIVRTGIPKSAYTELFAPVIAELKEISRTTGAELLDPSAELCRADFCSAYYGGDPIYKDVGHIRPFFVRDHITVFDHVVLK